MRTKITISVAGVFVVVLGALYWASARHAVSGFLDAYEHGDAGYVDQLVDWQTIVPHLEKQFALSFPDPNAVQAAKIAASAYRSTYLANITNNTAAPLDHRSQGFAHFDEYTVQTTRGNTYVFSRRGLQWSIEDIRLTLSNARLYTISQVAIPEGRGPALNVYNGDLYFADPSFGCRLTTVGDVVAFGGHVKPVESSDASKILITYVRRTHAVLGKSMLEVWQLLVPSFDSRLLLKGEEEVDQGASLVPDLTDETPLQFSDDGRYLYYNSRAYAVSDAIVELDTEKKTARIVADGNGVYVVRQGRFTGALVTSQHRYRPEGGSYNWAYVIDRTGKELMNSGDEVDIADFIGRVEGIR